MPIELGKHHLLGKLHHSIHMSELVRRCEEGGCWFLGFLICYMGQLVFHNFLLILIYGKLRSLLLQIPFC